MQVLLLDPTYKHKNVNALNYYIYELINVWLKRAVLDFNMITVSSL